MQTEASKSETSTIIKPTIVSAAASWSIPPPDRPPRPPSTAIEIEKISPPTSHPHSDSAAARGNAMAGEPTCNGTIAMARPTNSGTTARTISPTFHSVHAWK